MANVPGKSTKWTKARGEKIVSLLREGRFKAHVCAKVGIDRKTLYNWISESENGQHKDWPGFPGFHLRVLEAEADYCQELEKELLIRAAEGKNPDWKGAAWMLEKKHPLLYGDQAKKVELSGSVRITISDILDAIDAAEKGDDGED